MNLQNKNITIIGAGRSGLGAAKLIKTFGGIPFVSDSASFDKLKDFTEQLEKYNIEFEIGGHSGRVYESDLMVVSPGVPSDAEVILNAKSKSIKVISEIELAYNFCKGKIIAITGTNGKTTTTNLLNHLLNSCGKTAYAAGNIGLAFSEIVSKVQSEDFVCLEVSSFQLDLIDKFKPNVAIILNITPDHLNRYGNKIENYISSKFNICKNLTAEDSLILNADSDLLINNLPKTNTSNYFISLKKKYNSGASLENDNLLIIENGTEKVIAARSDLNLLGEHNLYNALSALVAANIFNLNREMLVKSLRTFKAVEHRLELVREIDGVKYYNDSKATNVDSVWYALGSFDQPIFLILGGQDKGNEYNQIKDLVIERVKKIYAIGSSAKKIFDFFHTVVKVEIKNSLEEAVKAGNLEARENEVVLLSPACASFDMFENYEHRGKVFKQIVNNL